jgi:phage terminase large subunit-like protein
MSRHFIWRLLYTLAELPRETARRVLASLSWPTIHALREEWFWQAHRGQHEPPACPDGSLWRIWAIVAGRGFGKTRVGAEWVSERAREDRAARIALVGASLDEVARVMVEGESGILRIARLGEAPRWIRTRGLLLFPSGARGFAYTAERPAKLRGPQHHFAWADELAKWPHADATWDNLMMGLRLGESPRTIVTTTPKPVPLLKRVLALPRCVHTQGRTDQNPHLPADFRQAVTEMYGGTRLGRQELEGILFEDVPGALWTREMLDAHRAEQIPPVPSEVEGRFTRIVIGVDPPAGADGDACGIVACGLGHDAILYVLADHTVSGLRPAGRALPRAGGGALPVHLCRL